MLLGAFIVAVSSVGASADVDTTAWTTKAVPKTPFTVNYPSTWKVEKPKSVTGHTVVFRSRDRRNGDNLVVIVYTGKDASWYRDLAEYQQVASDERDVQ